MTTVAMVVVFLSSITVGLLALCSGVAGSPARARIVERAEDIKDSYDYVIAGGGTAGLTVADRLTASGKCMHSKPAVATDRRWH